MILLYSHKQIPQNFPEGEAPMLKYYGVLSLLPIASLFATVYVTKRVIVSILTATIVAAILLGGVQCVDMWYGTLLEAFKTVDFLSWVIILFAVYGILIALLEKSGWCLEFAGWLSQYSTTRVKTLLYTELLGIVIFIDDVLNNVAVGTSMKKLTDSHLIPRTLLSYISISTSAPVCILLPVSSWAFSCAAIMMTQDIAINDSFIDTYMATVPYMFFGYATLVVVFLVCIGVIPPLGTVREHSIIAERDHIVAPANATRDGKPIHVEIHHDDLRTIGSEGGLPWKFLSTLVVISVVTFFHGDVIVGAIIGIIYSFVVLMLLDKWHIGELFNISMEGLINMVPVMIQMTLASTLLELNTKLGMQNYVLEIVVPLLSSELLPVLTFCVFTVYSALGGGFIEMILLFIPVVVPAAHAVGANPYVACAALISASASGSSLYVCGDTVAVVSAVNGLKPTTAAKGILPYCLIACLLTALCFLITGLVL